MIPEPHNAICNRPTKTIRATPPGMLRSSMGGGPAIMIDPVNGTLMGASDPPQRWTGSRLLIPEGDG